MVKLNKVDKGAVVPKVLDKKSPALRLRSVTRALLFLNDGITIFLQLPFLRRLQ